MYFIRIRWIPGLAAFAGIGAAIHAVWANDTSYVIAIPLGILVGWGFWRIVDPLLNRSRKTTDQAWQSGAAVEAAPYWPPPSDSQTALAAQQEPQTKACPDCAESILAAARVCRYCGYRFGPAAP